MYLPAVDEDKDISIAKPQHAAGGWQEGCTALRRPMDGGAWQHWLRKASRHGRMGGRNHARNQKYIRKEIQFNKGLKYPE
uniref:Uncharacterized protein n=1 Tax=Oryza meridionalis TaxID=40149 RepID=A0A0E0EPI7_9ORYZ